jgi:hypothetical protein
LFSEFSDNKFRIFPNSSSKIPIFNFSIWQPWYRQKGKKHFSSGRRFSTWNEHFSQRLKSCLLLLVTEAKPLYGRPIGKIFDHASHLASNVLPEDARQKRDKSSSDQIQSLEWVGMKQIPQNQIEDFFILASIISEKRYIFITFLLESLREISTKNQ